MAMLLGAVLSVALAPPPRLAPAAVRRLDCARQSLQSHAGLLIIDGNNVRAATGFRYSATEMQQCLEIWAEQTGCADRTAVVWDHGSRRCAFHRPGHTATLLSGNEQTADDVIVQTCAYILNADLPSADVMVVTSDQALRGRCRTQLHEMLALPASDRHEVLGVSTLHSAFLMWLVETDKVHGWRGSAALRARYEQPHQCRSERTEHRIEQAEALLTWEQLRRTSEEEAAEEAAEEAEEEAAEEAAPMEAPRGVTRGDADSPSRLLTSLASWYGRGCDGLDVARESRTGNPIYALRR